LLQRPNQFTREHLTLHTGRNDLSKALRNPRYSGPMESSRRTWSVISIDDHEHDVVMMEGSETDELEIIEDCMLTQSFIQPCRLKPPGAFLYAFGIISDLFHEWSWMLWHILKLAENVNQSFLSSNCN